MLEVKELKLPGVFLLSPPCFSDERGWFMETWSQREWEALGLRTRFVQDNESYSEKKHTLRGLHYQEGDASQAKLVRCLQGAVLDVAVDLREESPGYLQWVAVELTQENRRQLFVPRGFAHGYLTLTDGARFAYKVDNFYAPRAERILRWNDPQLHIHWGVEEPVLAPRDRLAPLLRDSSPRFVYRPEEEP